MIELRRVVDNHSKTLTQVEIIQVFSVFTARLRGPLKGFHSTQTIVDDLIEEL